MRMRGAMQVSSCRPPASLAQKKSCLLLAQKGQMRLRGHRSPPRKKRQEIGSPSKHGSIFSSANIGQAASEHLLPCLDGPEATNHSRPLVSARTAGFGHDAVAATSRTSAGGALQMSV